MRYERVDDPRPGPGQVRIAAAASGIHLIDTMLRRGESVGPLPVPELPTIPGREVAGVVGAARGAAKLERVRDLGADVAVDYGARGWGDTVRDALGSREVTVALDDVGGELGRAALELVGTGGRPALLALKRRRMRVDAVLMAARAISVTCAIAGAVLLGGVVHPLVGSGLRCEGLGVGCTPERDMDTLLIVAVYSATALGTLLVAWQSARRGWPWRSALRAGIAITVLATAAAVWSQLPRHPVSPGPLRAASEQWERVLADGRAATTRGTPLGDALHDLQRRGPLVCRDAYGRSTGAREIRWSNGSENAYAGSPEPAAAVTAAALGHWADRLRRRGVDVEVSDPGGDPASDRRLRVGSFGAAAGGVLYVRASFYISALETTATTGCHRD